MKESSNEILDKLLGYSNFKELTPENQQKVLQEMSQEEYDIYHALIQKSKANLNPSTPLSPASLNEIKKSLGHQLSPNHTIRQRIFNTQIPLWLVVSSFLISLGTIFLLNGKRSHVEETKEVNPLVVRDTIFVESIDTIFVEIQTKPKVIIKEVIKIIEAPIVTPMAVINLDKDLDKKVNQDESAYYSKLETAELLAGRLGKSIGEEAELMELLESNKD